MIQIYEGVHSASRHCLDVRNEGRKSLRSFSNFWPEELDGRRVGGQWRKLDLWRDMLRFGHCVKD